MKPKNPLLKTPLILISLSGLFAWFFVQSLSRSHYPHERTDLIICLDAARRLLEGLNVYLSSDLWAHTKPPFATMFFIPLAKFSNNLASHIWDFFNLLALVVAAAFFSKEIKKIFPSSNTYLVALAAITLCINFWGYELRFGQYNMICLVFLWLAGKHDSKYFAAPLFWIAFFIKPSHLIFLPWALKDKKNYKVFFLSSLSFLTLLSAVYAVAFGFENLFYDHLTWLDFMKVASHKYLMRDVNFGFPLFFGYFTSQTWPQHLLLLAGLGGGFFG